MPWNRHRSPPANNRTAPYASRLLHARQSKVRQRIALARFAGARREQHRRMRRDERTDPEPPEPEPEDTGQTAGDDPLDAFREVEDDNPGGGIPDDAKRD